MSKKEDEIEEMVEYAGIMQRERVLEVIQQTNKMFFAVSVICIMLMFLALI